MLSVSDSRLGMPVVCRILLSPLARASVLRSLWRSWVMSCLTVIVFSVCSGCGRKKAVSPLPQLKDSHTRMLNLLKEHAKRAAHDHPILGDKKARMLRQQLDQHKSVPPLMTLRLQRLMIMKSIMQDKVILWASYLN